MDLQPLVGVPGDAVRLAVVDESEPPDERQVKTDALDVCHTGDYTITRKPCRAKGVHCIKLTGGLWYNSK